MSTQTRALDSDARPDDDGCPSCGQAIQYIESRGPSDIRAQPCGCRIGFARGRGYDGGDP